MKQKVEQYTAYINDQWHPVIYCKLGMPIVQTLCGYEVNPKRTPQRVTGNGTILKYDCPKCKEHMENGTFLAKGKLLVSIDTEALRFEPK